MLELSEHIGQIVWSADGERVGRLRDLAISFGATEPVVHLLVIGAGGDEIVLPWDAVTTFESDRVELQHGMRWRLPAIGEGAPLDPTEVRLSRDVLDAQIVDLRGHRLLRASDVLLARRNDDTLIVVGVDVGVAAIVRRLGLRRLSARFRERVVPWSDLHLTSRRGHHAQLTARSAHLHRLDADGLAHLLARLTVSHASDVLQQASVERGAGAIDRSRDDVSHRLLAALPEDDAHALLEALPKERAHHLRHLLKTTAIPRRRYHRTRGWKRHHPAGRETPDRP